MSAIPYLIASGIFCLILFAALNIMASAEAVRRERINRLCSTYNKLSTHELLSLKNRLIEGHGLIMDWPEAEQVEAIDLIIKQRAQR